MDTRLEWRPRLARIEGSGGTAFLHPCHVCGNPNAPFGERVSLLKGQPGTWTCFEHWPGRARIEAERAEQAGDAF